MEELSRGEIEKKVALERLEKIRASKPKKFTFKTTKPKGRYSWLNEPHHEILLKKIPVGTIGNNNKITLHVIKDDIMVDGNPNCCWNRTYLEYEAPTLNDAKVFLNDNFEIILKQFNLYVYED